MRDNDIFMWLAPVVSIKPENIILIGVELPCLPASERASDYLLAGIPEHKSFAGAVRRMYYVALLRIAVAFEAIYHIVAAARCCHYQEQIAAQVDEQRAHVQAAKITSVLAHPMRKFGFVVLFACHRCCPCAYILHHHRLYPAFGSSVHL